MVLHMKGSIIVEWENKWNLLHRGEEVPQMTLDLKYCLFHSTIHCMIEEHYLKQQHFSSRSTLCSVMAQLTDDIQPSFETTLKSKAVSENCNVRFTCVVSGRLGSTTNNQPLHWHVHACFTRDGMLADSLWCEVTGLGRMWFCISEQRKKPMKKTDKHW